MRFGTSIHMMGRIVIEIFVDYLPQFVVLFLLFSLLLIGLNRRRAREQLSKTILCCAVIALTLSGAIVFLLGTHIIGGNWLDQNFSPGSMNKYMSFFYKHKNNSGVTNGAELPLTSISVSTYSETENNIALKSFYLAMPETPASKWSEPGDAKWCEKAIVIKPEVLSNSSVMSSSDTLATLALFQASRFQMSRYPEMVSNADLKLERNSRNNRTWNIPAIDWEAMTKACIPEYTEYLTDEVAESIHSGERGYREYAYKLPLNDLFPKQYFYMVSAEGLQKASPDHFLGTVNLSPGSKSLHYEWDIQNYGQVCLSDTVSGDGFVLYSIADLNPKTEDFNVSGIESLKTAIKSFKIILPSLNQEYLFVQRPPDTECKEGCCEIRYRLYELDTKTNRPSEKPIAAFDGRCDL